MGLIGIKVWIYKGEVLPEAKLAEGAGTGEVLPEKTAAEEKTG
jgi:ribosomal protein S3